METQNETQPPEQEELFGIPWIFHIIFSKQI